MGKLMGAVLLTAGGLFLGLEAAAGLSRRRAALEAWETALALMEGELAFSLPDLPTLLTALSRRVPAPARETMAAALKGLDRVGEQTFEDIWTGTLQTVPGALAGEDVDLLARLGAALGRYGWEDQRSLVRQLREELSRRRVRVGEERDRTGRAYGTLGFALGAFLTILLL